MGAACTTQDSSSQSTEVKSLAWSPSKLGQPWFVPLDEPEDKQTDDSSPSPLKADFASPSRNGQNSSDPCSSWPVISVDILYREHLALLTEAGLEWSSWTVESLGMSAEDALLVVDVQNDFITNRVAPLGGRTPVSEGEAVVQPVTQLIEAFSKRSNLIVATRAFHPSDHCSFYEQGGPSPPHCRQTTPGSFFYQSVGEALHRAYTEPLGKSRPDGSGLPGQPGRVEIAFKGFLEEVASPGAFRYDQEHFEQRLTKCRWNLERSPRPGMACAGVWTGAMALKCSNLVNDINCNPDLSALLQEDLRPLDEVISRSGRLLIVGLPLDTNVLDTAVAASRLGYEKVFVAIDACRPTHFGMNGEYGSGFLTDPTYIVSQFKKYNIGIVQFSEVLQTFSGTPSPKRKANSPETMGGG